MSKRECFSSKLGFVISCIGAAIGLGNVWMFPYKLGENGGSAFLIPYFLFVIILGVVGLMQEFSFGRMYKKGSLGAIRQVLKDKNIKGGKIISVIPTLGLTGIFIFYTVVIGWVFKYFFISLTGKISSINTKTYFQSFVTSPEVIIWHALAVIVTLIIVSFGIIKGIEKINKIVIPLLFVIFIGLIIKSLSLPNSFDGIEYLLKPNWTYLLKPVTWVMAMGQAFFTVSITGCCMVMCGSYAEDNFNIPNCALNTAAFDTLSAILAAFMIMPAVFALELNPTAGPALMFVTLPSIFQTMPFGSFLSSMFFLSIIFASISSSIAMLEGPVEAVLSVSNWSRKKATIIIATVGFIFGIPLELNGEWFNNFTNFITIILSPLGAVITAFIFYYMVDNKKALNEINKGTKYKLGYGFIKFGKYIFVPATIIIIVLGAIYGGIG